MEIKHGRQTLNFNFPQMSSVHAFSGHNEASERLQKSPIFPSLRYPCSLYYTKKTRLINGVERQKQNSHEQ